MENIVRKGEIACYKQLLLFLQCFLPYMALIFDFKCTLKCLLAICLTLDQFKIFSSGNGFIDQCTGISNNIKVNSSLNLHKTFPEITIKE